MHEVAATALARLAYVETSRATTPARGEGKEDAEWTEFLARQNALLKVIALSLTIPDLFWTCTTSCAFYDCYAFGV